MLDNAEVQEHEGKQVHYEICTIGGNNVAECRHLVYVIEYFFHCLID